MGEEGERVKESVRRKATREWMREDILDEGPTVLLERLRKEGKTGGRWEGVEGGTGSPEEEGKRVSLCSKK